MGGVTTRQGGDHDLGKAHRQGTHGSRAQRRAATTTKRDDAIYLSFLCEPGNQHGCRLAHRHHALTAILALHQSCQIDATCLRHSETVNVRCHRGIGPRADINQQWAVSLLADQIGDKGVLLSLGVKGAEHGDGFRFRHLRKCV